LTAKAAVGHDFKPATAQRERVAESEPVLASDPG
jgi:hypothetical protein